VKVHLVGHNFEFIEADDGERALRLVRPLSIDLVIADVHMPLLDGIAFVRHLRSCSDIIMRRLPVVLLTGDSSAGLRHAAMSAGASAFFRKPVPRQALTDAIDELLSMSGPRRIALEPPRRVK
jgi:two-component system chemotaxis response regulator CheY